MTELCHQNLCSQNFAYAKFHVNKTLAKISQFTVPKFLEVAIMLNSIILMITSILSLLSV